MKRAVPVLLALLALAGCGSAARHAATATVASAPAAEATPKPKAKAPTPAKKRIPHVPAPHSAALRPHFHRHRAKRASRSASSSGASATSNIAPGAPSDAEVEKELAKAMGYKSGTSVSTHKVETHGILQPDGLVEPPPAAPYAVQAIIAGGNEVAHLPYVYGGGHGTWIDSAYDCSGSVSFALANAGMLDTQEDSTQLAKFGAPGPGKWVTIYANAVHAWMVVAGIRFDTSGRAGPRGSRWQAATRSTGGFVVRHPVGL